jgi:anaerobic magnesium-protoporphyrin IX monomethyl ester cyclase
LSGEVIHKIRSAGIRKLFVYKLTHYPIQILSLLRRFLRYMPLRDVLYLIVKPFLGQRKGATKAEVLSRAVEHANLKDEAAELTRLSDDALERAIVNSGEERLRWLQ